MHTSIDSSHRIPGIDQALIARMRRFLDPASVAIVGASESAGAFGARTLANLEPFQGDVFPVNPKYTSLSGRRCYASLDALPAAPDCVILAVPRSAVEDLVIECARIKAGGVVVYASGYGETGDPEGASLQQRLARLSHELQLPILGPNCVGAVVASSGLRATFATVPALAAQAVAGIGIVAQSGALGISLLQAAERGVPFSHLLTAGNCAGIDVADLVAYLVGVPHCKAIVCQFEGLPEPRKLLQVGEMARAAGKPVILYKLAQGKEGAAAALSHTGSLAGAPEAYRALFERAGFVVVDGFEMLVETAALLSKAGQARTFGAAMLTGSGGAAILAADAAEKHGIGFPDFEGEALATIASFLPPFAKPRNPCDLTANMLNDPQALPACAQACLESDDIDVLVVAQTIAGVGTSNLQLLADIARRTGKTVCVVWLTEWLEGPGARQVEADPHLVMFRSMDRCMAALARWRAWRTWCGRAVRLPAERVSDWRCRDEARDLLHSLRSGGVLTESAAKRALQAYGIPVVHEVLVDGIGALADATQATGFPLAMKIESADIAHKTEAGGVRLHIRTPEEAAGAYQSILEAVRTRHPQAVLKGILVQPMVAPGLEIIIGGRIDPLFGPLLLVGMGGVLVELLQDTALALCPLTRDGARELLAQLRGRPLLDGFRSADRVDVDALADIVCRVSEFLDDQQDLVAEADINPLICSAGRIVAADALIVLRSDC